MIDYARWVLRRRLKTAVALLAVLLAAAGWYAQRRRQALEAFREGAAAYYRGETAAAEDALRRSLRLARDPRVAELLSSLLIERGLRRLEGGDPQGAARALDEAARLAPERASIERAARSAERGPLTGADALEKLALPDGGAEPPSASKDVGAAQRSMEAAVRRALRLAAAVLAVLLGALAWLAWALFGPRGVLTKLLADQTHGRGRPALAGPAPDAAASPSAIREIEAIEAEFTVEADDALVERLLKPYLAHTDPAVRTKAAGALWKSDPQAAAAALERAVSDPDPELQAAAARALLVLKHDPSLDPDEKARVEALLAKVRQRWIV